MKIIKSIFPPKHPMKRLEYAVMHNHSDKQMNFADDLDMFEFHYRGYLDGFHKTLRMVFWLVRHYKDVDFNTYKRAILSIVDDIEKDILTKEAYEIMDKHIKTKDKILKLLNKLNH